MLRDILKTEILNDLNDRIHELLLMLIKCNSTSEISFLIAMVRELSSKDWVFS